MGQFAQHCRVGAEVLAPFIYETALKATLLLILAAIITSVCQRQSASFRHQIWLFAVLGVLALPMVSFSFPGWRILPNWSALPEKKPVSIQVEKKFARGNSITSNASKGLSSSAPIDRRTVQEQILFYSAAIWAAGAILVSIRLAASILMLRLSIRRARPATDVSLIELFEAECASLNLRNICLRVDDRRRVPFVCGIWRPSLIVPASSTTWAATELTAVLRHELVHIKRRDTLTLALCSAASVVYWFNPLLWFAVRELNIEAEKSCDDYVLRTEIDRADYATQLVTASWFAQESDLPALAITRRSQLERRVRAALEPNLARSGITFVSQVTTASCALLVVFPLALAQPQKPGDRGVTLKTRHPATHEPSRVTKFPSFEPHVAIELHANGTSSLTLDQFNLPEVSRTLSRIADRNPRSLVLIRHTGQTNHAAVIHAARLCREAGLRCTFVSNFTSDTSPQLPPEFQALPSKARLVSLNVDAAGRFGLRAHGFSKSELIAALDELRFPVSRVVIGSRDLFREFSNVQSAARAIAMAQ